MSIEKHLVARASNEPGRIHDLSMQEVESCRKLLFDPETESTDEIWKEMKEQLLIYSTPEKRYTYSRNGALQLAWSMRVLRPDRMHDVDEIMKAKWDLFAQSIYKDLGTFDRFGIDRSETEQDLEDALLLMEHDPARFHEKFDISLAKESRKIYQFLDESSRSSVRHVVPYRLLLRSRLLYPEGSSMRLQLNDLTKRYAIDEINFLKELVQRQESGFDPEYAHLEWQEINVITERAAFLKATGPDIAREVMEVLRPLLPNLREKMKRAEEEFPTRVAFLRARRDACLAILAAERAEMTESGIHLTWPKESFVSEKKPRPVRKHT